MAIVFLILALTSLLFLWDRLPLELVGFLAVLALVMTGVLEPGEAFQGFSNSLLVVLGGLFVVGGALVKTGVANLAAGHLERWSEGKPARLLIGVVLGSAMLSSVMSSTGTAAVLIPAVAGAARRMGQSPSGYLIPLAYGCLIGGMLTLFGTAPNLVVDEVLRESGAPGFGLLSFAPVGAALLLIALLYLGSFNQKLFPPRVAAAERPNEPTLEELLAEYHALDDLHGLRIPTAGWQARDLRELKLRSAHGIEVLGLREPGAGTITTATPESLVPPGATLWVRAQAPALQQFCAAFAAESWPYTPRPEQIPRDHGVAEVLLTPRSKLLGKTLAQLNFARLYGVRVHSIRRSGQNLTGPLSEVPLRYGDTLLVEGRWSQLEQLRDERFQFVVIGMPRELTVPDRLTAPGRRTLIVFSLMLASVTMGWLPLEVGVLLAAVLIVLLGCLSMEEAYASIHWSSLFLVATMLAMATALSKTGGLERMAGWLLAASGSSSRVGLLVGIFLLTSMLSQIMSNTATTVVLAPVAVDAASRIGASPEPFLMAVAVAASAAFATPMASPVNTLVLGPGGYRLVDYLRAGLPLQIVTLVLVIIMVPWLFPF
jgi:di/tricarboxylate transporter